MGKVGVFWVSEPVQPGDVVMLYGGGLREVSAVRLSRLPDAPVKAPFVRPSPSSSGKALKVTILQGDDACLKFVLPEGLKQGVFKVVVGDKTVFLNRPKVEWCQPTSLLPGMRENDAAPGQTVQVIGRNFLLEGGEGAKAQVALVNSQGKAILLKPTKVEKYSLLVPLPSNLPLGEY